METRATLDRRSGKSLWEGCLAIKTRATSLRRSVKVAPGCVPQRLHGVAPVRSLWCAVRPLIALNTSFELQMYPNVSKNSMWYSNTR
ncbi:hypothetical protein DY000_02043770 [Brassica cretica]|uniref:Uncharacterized protein n=1 Tax=Brassica cretica TaxID=69181 RepID=A0ABQ7BBD5_BRACR|nr:hypothetical protein DY000_02043770 [Brassica cretica]